MKQKLSQKEIAVKDLKVIWWAIKAMVATPIKLILKLLSLDIKGFVACLILFIPMVLSLLIKIAHRVFKILTSGFNYLQLKANIIIHIYQRQ